MDRSALITADLVPGLPLGEWVLLAPLGHGGQSVVWKARPRDGGAPVALKLLSSRLAWNAGWRERFAREARIGQRLDHPGIVRILGAGEARGRLYLVQELVPGGRTLADELASARAAAEPRDAPPRPLPPEHFADAAQLLAQVAEALHAVHEAGILHRDVKPGNVLITPDARAKLSDFGCAADAADLDGRDGTPAYSSPEQLRGAPLDRRSDVFALGATLHEALTLRRAFDGRSAAEVRAAVLACRPADACALRPEAPARLAAIAARCLQLEPARRYATAGEVGEALRGFLRPPVRREPLRFRLRLR
jgi:eukaryotic-like serine/threonine-protein kinase